MIIKVHGMVQRNLLTELLILALAVTGETDVM